MKLGETDFIETGSGEKVILVHSSVAGAKQWRSLMETLSNDFHVIAINLFGYGDTRSWEVDGTQRLTDQARLIEPFLPKGTGKISIVGHSFGGCVAMMAAAMFNNKVRRLVLIEPNPFYLLQKFERAEAYQEAVILRDAIKSNGKSGTWAAAAEVFANYWTGAGSWDAMPDDRKAKFARALIPNFHEWDAVMNEVKSFAEWQRDLPNDTTIVSARDTVRSIREIVELMKEHVPEWRFKQIERGGHMAAMTKPDVINPIVLSALT
ncbi:alpha/beta fold hydrolase [Aliiroseovarius sp. KMU-50]|uniref:Alpha/beta fold hydrolase n=1 Tax=Aliiroseovarius salicola TaxID=3009082 RepID=A0ABT4W292_9RHOB|nr:alpha/beta fold hydrolase [Aliiroseovarius sp. KMU-50]MDA5093917.1 alpha/beta fold hydrolase [Aliiroseovarius sp. KMU-50]